MISHYYTKQGEGAGMRMLDGDARISQVDVTRYCVQCGGEIRKRRGVSLRTYAEKRFDSNKCAATWGNNNRARINESLPR